ncbi:hypothetical protein [Bradyrhizobium sp. LB14.3]|uniref:hypothetical protein n=1 Tax=Bradyrhizobium sp. LB14.3 TaxID=3156328 RepID=UPI003399D128
MLPDGFHRIRHFGFMTNGQRAAKLALCRKLLDRERTVPNDGEPSPVDSEALTSAKVPPVLIVVASCASSSAFDTATAAPTLEPHRCDATHREPSSCPARRSSFSAFRSSPTLSKSCGHTARR